MSGYTVQDFQNAKFAEHPSGERAFWVEGNYGVGEWHTDDDAFDDAEMVGGDWVPVSTKPTMTRSQYEDATRNLNAGDKAIFGYALHIAGVEISPAPEPTNAEKLAEIFRDAPVVNRENAIHGDDAIKAWAEYLDANGVKAGN